MATRDRSVSQPTSQASGPSTRRPMRGSPSDMQQVMTTLAPPGDVDADGRQADNNAPDVGAAESIAAKQATVTPRVLQVAMGLMASVDELVNARMAVVEEQLAGLVAGVEERVNARLAVVEEQLAVLVEGVGNLVADVETGLAKVDAHVDALDAHVDALDARLAILDARDLQRAALLRNLV